MRYVGSKNKLSKELAPIIQSYINENTKGYIEIFVGGCNMIDKINHINRIGFDIHEELIELLKYAQNNSENLPEKILEEEYVNVKNNKEKYPKWYIGLVGFCSSFGAKYFGGYARDSKDDISGKWSKGAINNLKKQIPFIKDVKLKCLSFQNIPKEKLNGLAIYCDPPYKDTTKYKTEEFPYEEFYNWCTEVSNNNIVLISEYYMPEDRFECIWEKKVKTTLGSGVNDTTSNDKIRVEKLFRVRKEKE